MRALKDFFSSLFLVVVCFSSTALGQQTTGAISGAVVDPSGAAVSGATVQVTGEGTNISRSVVSDASGRYAVDLLPVGDYSVKVSNPGFKTYEQKGIHLLVNQDARVDAALQTGAVQQVVVVQSNATQLETASSTMGKAVAYSASSSGLSALLISVSYVTI